jgi:hypothetical protein
MKERKMKNRLILLVSLAVFTLQVSEKTYAACADAYQASIEVKSKKLEKYQNISGKIWTGAVGGASGAAFLGSMGFLIADYGLLSLLLIPQTAIVVVPVAFGVGIPTAATLLIVDAVKEKKLANDLFVLALIRNAYSENSEDLKEIAKNFSLKKTQLKLIDPYEALYIQHFSYLDHDSTIAKMKSEILSADYSEALCNGDIHNDGRTISRKGKLSTPKDVVRYLSEVLLNH